jgi:hypothetical protein
MRSLHLPFTDSIEGDYSSLVKGLGQQAHGRRMFSLMQAPAVAWPDAPHYA